MSHAGPRPLPTCSPLNSIGALSFSPSPITTTPSKLTVPRNLRIASTAAPSAPSLSPLPMNGTARIAAASVARTSSSARLRSGCRKSVPVSVDANVVLFVLEGAVRRGGDPRDRIDALPAYRGLDRRSGGAQANRLPLPPQPPEEPPQMPVATPDQYAEMLDKAKQRG